MEKEAAIIAWSYSEIINIAQYHLCELYQSDVKISLKPDYARFFVTENGLSCIPLFETDYRDISVKGNSFFIKNYEFRFLDALDFKALSKRLEMVFLYDTKPITVFSHYNQLIKYIKTSSFKLNNAYRATGDANMALSELEKNEVLLLLKNRLTCYVVKGIAIVELEGSKREIEVDVLEDIVASSSTEARKLLENDVINGAHFVKWQTLTIKNKI